MYPHASGALAPTFIGALVGSEDRLPEWQHAFTDPRAPRHRVDGAACCASGLPLRPICSRRTTVSWLRRRCFLISMRWWASAIPSSARKRAAFPVFPAGLRAFEMIQREGRSPSRRCWRNWAESISLAALDKALGELWSKLRITRVDYKASEGRSWDVLYRWAPER